MKQKISVDRQITLKRLQIKKYKVLALLPHNLLEDTDDPLVLEIRNLYLQYTDVLLSIFRYLATEAGYKETNPDEMAAITEYGKLIDFTSGNTIENLLKSQENAIIVDIFEKDVPGDDYFAIYMFDPKSPHYSPTIAIHEAKEFENVFEAELDNTNFSRTDKLIFIGTIAISAGIYFSIDYILDFLGQLATDYQNSVGSGGLSFLTASLLVIVVVLRFGGKLIPKALKNLAAALFGVKRKERLTLKAKEIMSRRTDSRRVFVDLYTQARMPVDDDVGYDKHLEQLLSAMELRFYGDDDTKGLMDLLNTYWQKESIKWKTFPRTFIRKIPFIRRIVPHQVTSLLLLSDVVGST